MKNFLSKSYVAHVIAVVIFLAVTSVYFFPQLKGEQLNQTDILQFKGMSKEIADFRKETGEEALWTNSMFAGMPAYQISIHYKNNFLKKAKDLIIKIIPRPIGFFFLLMIGFYIMLICFRVNPWIAIIGSIAFGLSSLNIILIGGGHASKIHAISFIPPIIGGLYYAYRSNMLKGSIIVAIFLSLNISANHLQMTYYTMFLIAGFVLVEAYLFIKRKEVIQFFKISAVVFVAATLGVLTNITNILTTFEYSNYSTRSKTELVANANNAENKTAALDKDYIKAYSLGHGEVWSIVIPNVKGGKMDLVGNNKELLNSVDPNYRNFLAQQMTYWGEQAGTGGAIYFGASIFLLFILGLFFVKEKQKWALFGISVLAILLSLKYGNTVDWFIDHFPMFSKFRDTKMMLVLVQVSFPLLGLLFLNTISKEEINKKKFLYVVSGVSGVLLLMYIMPTVWFNFFSNAEVNYFDKLAITYKSNPNAISQINDIKYHLNELRIEVFKKDTIRSFFFIIITGGLIYFYLVKKIKFNTMILLAGTLILLDLWVVDRRYLNESSFKSVREEKAYFTPTNADKQILLDKDPNFKVLNLTVSPFNDASTSYHHKSLGGYHGAKLRRYQELVEHHIARNNMNVLNMLNTKYFIIPDNNKQPVAQYNPDALGNVWFVENYRIVENADAEIAALNNFNPLFEAIIDQNFEQQVEGKDFKTDTVSSITLESYKPNHLVYKAICSDEKLAVFSEIYYPIGWNAYIDGEQVDYLRANYVLRALVIPEGDHTVEFKFEPRSFILGERISLASSSLLVLILLIIAGRELMPYVRKNKE